ncbi:hypothetical protein TNCV_4162611 [Trichonephila clavipes]|nr:hypothetical protein TNCV_4162611 [Trichonephila clavipes]
MSTFNIPILPFLCTFLKTTQLSCRKNNSTRPLNSKIKANAGEKQLNSSVGTKQLNRRNNSTQQQGTNNSNLGSRNETTQLSRTETTQLCTAVDRLQPPTTACNFLQPPALQQNRFFYLLLLLLAQLLAYNLST